MGRERDAPKRRAVAEGISEGWRGNRSVLVGNARGSGGIFWCGGEAVHRSLAEEMQKKVYGNGLYVISSQYLCGMNIRIRYDFHVEVSKIPPPIALIYS